jgi:hypothetical protein
MQIKVFYSWQNDHPGKLGKDFIRAALESAAKRVGADRQIEVVIDSDTQDVPGTPPINDVILKKIDAAEVFVADVTFVATSAAGKRIPNPNVMAEYGYALHAKRWNRILLAMNTAFGPPESLPFDLHHHRHPATYAVATEKPDDARRDARSKLADRFEVGLRAIIDDLVNNRPAPPDLRKPLEAIIGQTRLEKIANRPPALISAPRAYVRVVPAASLEEPSLNLRAVKSARELLEPSGRGTAETGHDHTQWWSRDRPRVRHSRPNAESRWYGRLFRSGVIEHAFNIGDRIDDDPSIVVDGFDLERRIVDAADRGLELCAALDLAGPTLIAADLEEVDVELIGSVRTRPRVRLPGIQLTSALVPEGQLKSGSFMRRGFDDLWLAAGAEEGSPNYSDAGWVGYAHTSR